MNICNEFVEDQDPDYAIPGPSNNIRHQKFYEKTARINTSKKITAIIDKEFTKEIDAKENEILLIQNRLSQSLKTLHLLRYVIITDFYNRKQCIVMPQSGSNVSKQMRMHPAIKQIIGKSPIINNKNDNQKCTQKISTSYNINNTNVNNNELQTNHGSINNDDHDDDSDDSDTDDDNDGDDDYDRDYDNDHHHDYDYDYDDDDDDDNYNNNDDDDDDDDDDDNDNVTKKRHSEPTENNSHGPSKKIPRHIPPKYDEPELKTPSRGDRHKVVKRIVVGNISKWIPPDWRDDDASHKWTMYVRGSKENAQIDDFVAKIRFFLHPSYRPNDVVEITSPPFHLSRRGWGEFPLRVQLHFKNSSNKPMDIIHNLKLDRTYTGLQTLGSETIVDIWIKTQQDTFEQPQQEIHNSIIKDKINNDRKTDEQENNVTIDENSIYCTNNKFISQHQHSSNQPHHSAPPPPQSPPLHLHLHHHHYHHYHHNPPYHHALMDHDYINFHEFKSNNWPNDKQDDVHFRNNIDTITHKISNDNTDCMANIKDIHCDNSKNNINCRELKPLKIDIPPRFSSLKTQSTNLNGYTPKSLIKQVLVTNENQLIRLNLMKNNGISDNDNNKSYKSSGTSLLKFKFNPAKSLLLDGIGNNNVPALQIAHVSTQDNDKNYSKSKITVGRDKMKITTKREYYENILKTIENINIMDIESLLRFIIKRIPIIDENASDPEYKKIHPYACSSEKEFINYSVGKQRALEWYRAKAIYSYLKKKNLLNEQIWTIKEIMVWCRLHGHTPSIIPSIFLPTSTTITVNTSQSSKISANTGAADTREKSSFNTNTPPYSLITWQKKITTISNELYKPDESIDVVNIDQGGQKQIHRLSIVNDNIQRDEVIIQLPTKILPLHSFVCNTARLIGIRIAPEELEPGISHCAASRLIVKSVQCLLEDLLRSSLAKAWERSSKYGSCPDVITLQDVRGALLNRDEFDIFTNFGLMDVPHQHQTFVDHNREI